MDICSILKSIFNISQLIKQATPKAVKEDVSLGKMAHGSDTTFPYKRSKIRKSLFSINTSHNPMLHPAEYVSCYTYTLAKVSFKPPTTIVKIAIVLVIIFMQISCVQVHFWHLSAMENTGAPLTT